MGAPMFSRDEVLGGLPARRASTALIAIEGATARLAKASRINRASYIGERTAAEREQEFLAALASGAAQTKPPAIAELERFAPEWADQVPEDPSVRAAMARHLSAKHRFRRNDVPRLRAALGLGEAAVGEAYLRLHGTPLDAIYVARLPLADRLRWRVARVVARFDRLSPFWIAYFLAITETLGEGIMSVPIALAGLGPLPGVVLLLVLGGINLITLGALTESIVRSGSMRYGTAYFGRFVRELLGRFPASTLSIALAAFNVLTCYVYFLGFGSVLSGATGIPLGAWILVLFAINIVVLRKESLDGTIASAVLIGVINLVLVGAITLIAMLHVDPAQLGYMRTPFGDGRPIDPTFFALAFGVLLVAFFGHTSAANASKMVLTLEPSGRSLLWGNLAALATIIVLYCLATVAILGALGPEPLLGARGTAITPLAERVGPIVNVVGSTYVVLAIGIGSLYVTLGLYNQVIELLPRPSGSNAGPLARLSQTRRGRLLVGFAPTAAVLVGLELVVLAGQDNFAGPIAIGGALTVPLITGIFPMLLILAARRKGEYVPGRIIGLFGHPAVAATLLVFFIGATLAHGLVIWEGPAERAAALAVSAVLLVILAWAWRGGALRTRAVIELRRDRRQRRTTISVTASGQPVSPTQPVVTTDSAVTATVPSGTWRELRVWPHEVTDDGWSTGLAADVEVGEPASIQHVRLAASDEPHIIRIGGQVTSVAIRLAPREDVR
ncbi:MAG TPA: hypothetical protein VFK35_00440 [Candidatus Limnocylindrales bacterium]|nr:hypothetical protein [Candidatus Limnocylindrales bacterium]